MFRNTLTANHKYPFRDSENSSALIQVQLSLRQKDFSDFSNPFHEFTSNFKDFEKKYHRHSYFIMEFTGCEKLS